MATIAALLIDLGANVARLQKDMDQANRVISGWEKSTKSAVSTVKTAFAGLGVSIGAGAFVAGIKSAIDQADEFNKLSQKVGIATEALSELAYAAELSDVSREGLTKGLKSLSTNMYEAAQGGKEAASMFKGLGVEFESAPGKLRASDEVLGDLAERFSRMEDGAAKSALAVKLFGKEGLTMIPFLNQGKAGLQQLREEAQRLGIVMSAEMAASAERFNDNLRAVTASAEGLKIQMANQMLPGLNNIAKAMKLAAEEGGFLTTVLVGIGGAMVEPFSKSEEKKLREVQQRLEGLRKEWTALREAPGGWAQNGMERRLDNKQQQIVAAMKEEEEIKSRIAARDRDLRQGRPASKDTPTVINSGTDGSGKAGRDPDADLVWKQWVEHEEDWAKVMAEAADATTKMNERVQQREQLEYKWGRTFENMTGEEILDWEKRKYAAIDALEEIEDARSRLMGGFDENGNVIVDNAGKMKEAGKEVGLVFQSAASNAMRDWKGFGNLAKSILTDLAQAAMKKAIIDPLANAAGSAAGNFIGSLFSFAGGGYTGNGSRSGGLDGQGGFLAVMHPKESVTDHTMGGSGGGGNVTVVQHINVDSRSDRASILEAMRQAKDQAKAEILDSMNRGGQFARI